MNELKPCPFCGGKAQRMGHAGGIEFFCGNHDCIVQPCNHSTNERDALSAWNTRAVPDVPELVAMGAITSDTGELIKRDDIEENNILHIPLCRKDRAAKIIAAKDKEIERLKLRHTDEMNDFILMGMARDEFKNRAEAAEVKLAQYEAQEQVATVELRVLNGRRVKHIYPINLENVEAGSTLYASPAPAEDLKAANERLRAGFRKLMSGYVNTLENGIDRIRSLGGSCDDLDTMINNDPYLRDARAALNGEASNDKG